MSEKLQSIQAARKALETADDQNIALAKTSLQSIINENENTNDTEVKEEIEDIKAAQNKADRLWYDWSKFTTAEKRGRIAALIFASVCGIATLVGLSVQESVPFLSLYGIPYIGMLITFGVNLYGFWDNVPRALKNDVKESEKPVGAYAKLYTAFFILFAAAAIINSAGQLSPLLEVIEDGLPDGDEAINPDMGEGEPIPETGIDHKTYWYKFFLPILIFGGATAVSMVGLFTQAPREWCMNFTKNGLGRTIWEGLQSLWYGREITKDNPAPKMTMWLLPGALSRVLLFIAFNAIFTYAIYAATDYAGKGLVEVLQDFFSHATNDKMPVGWVNWFVQPFGYIFVFGRGIYNMTISQKLAIGASGFLNACYEIGAAQHKLIREKCAYMSAPVAGVIATVFFVPWTLMVAEMYCWQEAVKYARIQFNIKGSSLFLPHVFMRVLFNHMNLWGMINAYNNGAQNRHFYREGLDNPQDATKFKSTLAEVTGLASSLGFYLFAAKPRADKWKNGEKYIEMKSVGNDANKPTVKQEAVKTTWTTWWGWTQFRSEEEAKAVHLGQPGLM